VGTDEFVHHLEFEGLVLVWNTEESPAQRAPLRYRKGVWLLCYALSNPARVIYREALAEWFWAEQAPSDGRRSLRVLLADVQQALRQLGQPAALRVERDWIRWEHPAPVRLSIPKDMPSPPAVSEAGAQGPESVSEDFRSWWLSQNTQPLHKPAQAVTSLRSVALVRVDWQRIDPRVEAAMIGSEDGYPTSQVRERVAGLLERFDAERVGSDALGITFVLGRDRVSASYRSAALQLAGQILPIALAAQLPVRVGLCFGPVLITNGRDIGGWRIRLVERLAQVAEAGDLVCDHSFADRAESLGFDSMGEQAFRGFQRRFRVYRSPLSRLVDVTPVILGHTQGPLVGRGAALAALEASLRAVHEGARRACWLRGPAGMGKSRLAVELWRRHTDQGYPAVWIEGRPEGRDEPWAGLRTWVAQRLGSEGHALPSAQHNLLQGFCLTGGVAQTERPRLREAVAALAGAGPTLWVLDDVQWIDDASWQLLMQLAGEISQSQWLLTQRTPAEGAAPLCREGLPDLAAVVLDLPPLSDDDAQELWSLVNCDAESSKDEPSRAARAHIQSARGRPLYLVCRPGGGAPTPHFAEHCEARYNVLGQGRKVLELAAMLGMVWRPADLTSIVSEPGLSSVLEAAAGLELIVPRGPGWMAFFHPSLREFLLDGQTPAQRIDHARQLAPVIERQGQWALAAQFWQAAEDIQRASACRTRAALEAVAQDDHHAAITHFEILRRSGGATSEPQRALELCLKHAQARLVVKGYGDPVVQQLAADMVDLSAQILRAGGQLGQETAYAVTFLQYMGSSSQGQLDGLELGHRLWDQALTPAQRMVAAWALGNTHTWRGEHRIALHWLELAIREEPQTSLDERSALFVTDPLNFARSQALWIRSLLGEAQSDLDQESARLQALLAHMPQAQDHCIFHCMAAFRACTEGRYAVMRDHASAALAVSQGESYSLWGGVALLQQQLALAALGQPGEPEALPLALAALQAGYAAGVPTGQWWVAQLLHFTGQHQAALDLCVAWLAEMPRQEHRHCQMDIHRIRAECLSYLGRDDDANSAWADARAVAVVAGLHGWLRRWDKSHVVTGAHEA
jgi:hypothetical protein